MTCAPRCIHAPEEHCRIHSELLQPLGQERLQPAAMQAACLFKARRPTWAFCALDSAAALPHAALHYSVTAYNLHS